MMLRLKKVKLKHTQELRLRQDSTIKILNKLKNSNSYNSNCEKEKEKNQTLITKSQLVSW